jgi:DNA-binding transcriptional regulator YiaG
MAVTMKAARVNAGLTQKQAGEKLNVSRDTIRSWEQGKSFPDTMQIALIEVVYDTKYDDIIFCP